jgi:putative transcriptional regulator
MIEGCVIQVTDAGVSPLMVKDIGRGRRIAHPPEEMLLAYGAGSLGPRRARMVAAHLAHCPVCRADVAVAEAIGGFLVEMLTPWQLAFGGAHRTLARIGRARSEAAPVSY